MPSDLTREERLEPGELAELQRSKLANLLIAITGKNSFYDEKLKGFEVRDLHLQLEGVPFTSRAELERDQSAHPPYGSNLTHPLSRYVRIHQTSGSSGVPMAWLDTPESWAWFKSCWQLVYKAAEVRTGTRIAFTFSFGPFIGFWGGFEAAADLGCVVFPAGGMSSAARLETIERHQIEVVCCTPTYALRLVEAARESGVDLAKSRVRALIVAGEPGGNIPATRRQIETAWGARVFDHAGMTEMGAYGFECMEAPGGFHINEAEFIAEVVNPEGKPIPGEEIGELVLTNLGRVGSPLIRYRTGDMVRLVRKRCACGRWFARAEGGILGRADDMLVIRGNNVFPSAIEEVLRSFKEVAEYRLVVDRSEALAELEIEIEYVAGAPHEAFAARIEEAVRNRFHFRPRLRMAPPGSLPRFEMKSKRVATRG